MKKILKAKTTSELRLARLQTRVLRRNRRVLTNSKVRRLKAVGAVK